MFKQLSLGLVLSLAFFAADAPASTPSAAEIPISTFCKFPKVSTVKISPDGRYLAMIVADDKTGEGRKTLALITADQPHRLTATFSVVGDKVISNFWWVSNERVIVAPAEQSGSYDRPFLTGELFGVNVDGKQKTQLLPVVNASEKFHSSALNVGRGQLVYFYGLIYRSLDDPRHVIIDGSTFQGRSFEQPAQAYQLDVYTGETHQIFQSPAKGGGLIADNQGAVRLATGENTATGDAVLFYREDGHSLDWKDLSALHSDDDPAETDTGPEAFMPDDKHVYWNGYTKTTTQGLYDLDPETLSMKPIFEDPEFDVNDVITSFEWSKPQKIIGVETMPGLPKVDILDPDDLKSQYLAEFYKAFDGQEVEMTSNTADHSKFVLFVYSDRNPGEYYLFDTKTGQAQFLFASRPDIDPTKMGVMQPIEFQARDGLKVHGYLTIPAGSSGKNMPVITLPHGGPHGIRDEWGFDWETQLFASRGYAVLQINYRGSGGYGRKFQDLGYNNWGTTMQDDLADGVQWAVKQGYADPNRLCIYGASYGGYAALENPIRYPDLYKCTVGYVGVYDLTLQGKSGDTHHYAGGRKYVATVHADSEERQKAYSPAFNADKLKIPVFIVYGGQDQRVVPQNAEELMSAMDKLGKKYELMYEPNEMHGFYNVDHRIELYTRMLAFFDKYIGPDAAKAAVPATKGN